MLSLRLCAFVDILGDSKVEPQAFWQPFVNVPFSQPFASRYVSILFTDSIDNRLNCEQIHVSSPEPLDEGPSYDA